MAGKKVEMVSETPRSEDEVAKDSIRNLNVHMKAAGRAIHGQSIYTDIS